MLLVSTWLAWAPHFEKHEVAGTERRMVWLSQSRRTVWGPRRDGLVQQEQEKTDGRAEQAPWGGWSAVPSAEGQMGGLASEPGGRHGWLGLSGSVETDVSSYIRRQRCWMGSGR